MNEEELHVAFIIGFRVGLHASWVDFKVAVLGPVVKRVSRVVNSLTKYYSRESIGQIVPESLEITDISIRLVGARPRKTSPAEIISSTVLGKTIWPLLLRK